MFLTVTFAIALAGAVLAVAAVTVAQRNADNERVWFAVSGLARFSIALGVFAVALFASDHASDFVIAVFALVVLCVIVSGIVQLRRTAGKLSSPGVGWDVCCRRLRWRRAGTDFLSALRQAVFALFGE